MYLVWRAGFEPAATRAQTECSPGLSYPQTMEGRVGVEPTLAWFRATCIAIMLPAYVGRRRWTRTSYLCLIRAVHIPVMLRVYVWRPHGESNPDLLIDNQPSLPLNDESVVDRVGFEPTISRLRGGCCSDLATDPRCQRTGGQGRNRTADGLICSQPLCHLATRPGAPSRCRTPHIGFWRPDWTPVPGAW